MLLLLLSAPAAADDEDRALIGIPGYTKTDDVLRADVMRLAVRYVPALAKRKTGNAMLGACRRVAFVDAMITSIDDQIRGRWTETWTLDVCNAVVTMPISFESDDAGGTNFKLSDDEMTVENAAGVAP